MRYRKLDANGDYTIGTGADFLVNSSEAVAQAVETRLQLWTGEWFIDTTDGTPYDAELLGKHYGYDPDSMIKQRILQTQGVTAITSYKSAFDGNRRLQSINATIDTVYGAATVTRNF